MLHKNHSTGFRTVDDVIKNNYFLLFNNLKFQQFMIQGKNKLNIDVLYLLNLNFLIMNSLHITKFFFKDTLYVYVIFQQNFLTIECDFVYNSANIDLWNTDLNFFFVLKIWFDLISLSQWSVCKDIHVPI